MLLDTIRQCGRPVDLGQVLSTRVITGFDRGCGYPRIYQHSIHRFAFLLGISDPTARDARYQPRLLRTYFVEKIPDNAVDGRIAVHLQLYLLAGVKDGCVIAATEGGTDLGQRLVG